MSQICSYPTCNNILPPEIPGKVPFKTCDKCRERDRIAKAKQRAEKKRKRAGSNGNGTPRTAPNPPLDQDVTGAAQDGIDAPENGQGEYRDDSDESESGTDVGCQFIM
jgi:hypothetical protein